MSKRGNTKPGKACAGSPQKFTSPNTFEWLFSNPFENGIGASQHRKIDRIEGDKPILVDEASDRTLSYKTLHSHALTFATNLTLLSLSPPPSSHQPTLHPDNTTTFPSTISCLNPTIAPVVLIQLPNCLPFATILIGTLAAHLTASLVSPALTAKELGWVLYNCRPSVVFTTKSGLGTVREALEAQREVEKEKGGGGWVENARVFTVDVAGDEYPDSASRLRSSEDKNDSALDWTRLLALTNGSPIQPKPYDPSSRTAVILWSSGTSGRSKGVLLSHNALNFAVTALWHEADFAFPPRSSRNSSSKIDSLKERPQSQQQRWLGFVPFFHVFGLTNLLLLAIPTGSTIYTIPSFSLPTVLAAIPRRRITYLHMAPPVAVLLAKSPLVEPYLAAGSSTGSNAAERNDTRKNMLNSSLVGAVSAGAPLGHDIVAQIFERIGVRVRHGYGLTEAGAVTLQMGLEKEDMLEQAGDIGSPHWGVELMITPTTGTSPASAPRPVNVGVSGEVLVRSPCIFTAYVPPGGTSSLHLPSAKADMSASTEAILPGRWFRTGDIGSLDRHGRLRVTDRIKEIIKVKAFQVAPAELEAILCSDPGVADAGVVPVWDDVERTEWPRAHVVAAAVASSSGPGAEAPSQRNIQGMSEAELEQLAWRLRILVEKQAAWYKRLKGGIVFVDQIPKAPSGKILRRILKEGGVPGRLVDVYKLPKPKPRL